MLTLPPTYTQAKRIAFDYLKEYTRPLGAVVNVAELRVDFFRWTKNIFIWC